MARQLLKADETFTVREAELELEIPADPDAVYTLRPLTTDLAREIYKSHTTHVPNKRTHQREPVVDFPAVHDAMLDYCLTQWAGVTEDDGQMPPCDLPHKKELPAAVQAALIERAQIGQVAPEVQKASFRQLEKLVPVLAR